MKPVFPGPVVLVLLGLLLFFVRGTLRRLHPAWHASRAGKIAVRLAFGGAALAIAVWMLGRVFGQASLTRAGAAGAYVGLFMIFPAALTLPFAAGLDRIGGALLARLSRSRSKEPPVEALDDADAPPGPRVSRRSVLTFGTATLPAAAALGGASGFVGTNHDPAIRRVPLVYPELHPDLEGLKILQLSDLHLGAAFGLGTLERALAVAKEERPNLIVVTGDLADDVDLIADALRMVAEANAKYGALSILGNHEYIHRIGVVRPLFEASPVPLLVGEGRVLRVGQAKVWIGGADDPVHMSDVRTKLEPTIARAAANAPADADFRLLLCHRPEGFGPAAERGFDLTLAGHTHGGQLGFLGRSVFELVRPAIGWWGTYAKARSASAAGRTRSPGGPSQLYTTSGFGHWFPFRIGCPTEMPLVVLSSGRASANLARASRLGAPVRTADDEPMTSESCSDR